MDWKEVLLLAVVFLAVGSVAGAFIFPTTVTEYETVVEQIEVPGETIVVEVPVEVVKEVTVEDTERIEELEAELEALVLRYEQLSESRYDADDVLNELIYINEAKEVFQSDFFYELQWKDYKLSETEIVKFYNEEVSVSDVDRWVDGKLIEYEQATVEFRIKVAYEDEDGLEYRRYDVELVWDIDSDGVEEAEVDLWVV